MEKGSPVEPDDDAKRDDQGIWAVSVPSEPDVSRRGMSSEMSLLMACVER